MPGHDAPLLSEDLVDRIAALELVARVTAEGAMTGLHRSPRRGASVEFAEHKEYAPGDELRHVDWKTYGRSDRLYVKRFEEETELHALLVIDCSSSMRYGQGESDKLRYASVLAAAITYLLVTRRDRAGLLLTDGSAVPVAARPSHLRRVTTMLEQANPSGRADLPAALRRADALLSRRSQIIVFSDLLDPDVEAVLAAARSLRARGHDPCIVQVLHHDERTLPFHETAWYESDDDGARVLVDPQAVRTAYLANLDALITSYRESLQRARIPFAELDTSLPAADALSVLVTGTLTRTRRGR